MARAPRRYSDSDLYDWAGDVLDEQGKPRPEIRYDPDLLPAALDRLRDLIEQERIRKGRPAHRPPRNPRGREVAQRVSGGMKPSAAKHQVAAKFKCTFKTVDEAYRRWRATARKPSNPG